MARVTIKILLIAVLAALALPTEARAEGSSTDPPAQAAPAPSASVTSLHQWLLDRMLSWMPPGRSFIKDAKETKEEGTARYAEIADAMISVVYDPAEKPLFGGKYGRAKTLALVASISWFESGYRKDVDMGLGSLGRGDNGNSWCMMQILLGKNGVGQSTKRVYLTADTFKLVTRSDPLWDQAYGGEHLVKDRVACFRTGLHLVRNSFRACRRLPVEDRLGVYGSGKCIAGWDKSRMRVKKAQRWLASSRPPLTDEDALKLLSPAHPSAPALVPSAGPDGPVSLLPGADPFG